MIWLRFLCLPQVAIMAPDMASFQTVEEAGYSQEQDDIHPVTLLATSNGTHIAVQVGRPTPWEWIDWWGESQSVNLFSSVHEAEDTVSFKCRKCDISENGEAEEAS